MTVIISKFNYIIENDSLPVSVWPIHLTITKMMRDNLSIIVTSFLVIFTEIVIYTNVIFIKTTFFHKFYQILNCGFKYCVFKSHILKSQFLKNALFETVNPNLPKNAYLNLNSLCFVRCHSKSGHVLWDIIPKVGMKIL